MKRKMERKKRQRKPWYPRTAAAAGAAGRQEQGKDGKHLWIDAHAAQRHTHPSDLSPMQMHGLTTDESTKLGLLQLKFFFAK
jgi:hypothetical protein